MEELGRAAGVKVRNLRYYQGRGLLPPPRYEGRVALYSEEHLARLRLISDLLSRGYPVKGIAELLAARDRGSCVAEFLGYERGRDARAGPTDEPVVTCRAELRKRFGDQATEENLQRAVELGYLTIDGERVTHRSRQLLDGAEEMVREGVSLDVLLTVASLVRDHATELAKHLVTAVRTQVLAADEPDRAERPREADRVANAMATLRPMAGAMVSAEFARALGHQMATGSPPAAPATSVTSATSATLATSATPAASDTGEAEAGTGAGTGSEAGTGTGAEEGVQEAAGAKEATEAEEAGKRMPEETTAGAPGGDTPAS